MDLSPLIQRVRNNLSDIPESYVLDPVLLGDLRRAEAFVNLIKSEVAESNAIVTGIEFLAAYYTHVTWTTLVEKEQGEVPYSTIQKSLQHRSMARAYLSLISKYPLAEDLSIDFSKVKGTVPAFVLPTSITDFSMRW